MSSNFVLRLSLLVQRLEHSIAAIVNRKLPPSAFNYALAAPACEVVNHRPKRSLGDIFNDGILLFAVPRNRRTIEKRWKRKYGWPGLHQKFLTPKTHLRMCNTCGHDYEVGILCPHCYEKTIQETEKIKEKIQQEIKLDPVDKEVVVLYDGEKSEQPAEFWQGKRIVEMERQRPMWFTKNLLQKTTKQPDTETTDVKPDKLG